MILLLNKLKKLRRMPPREIAGRVASRWSLRRLERLAQSPDVLAGRVAGSEQAVLQACQSLVPGSSPSQWQSLKEIYPDEARQLAERSQQYAAGIADGRYRFLGRAAAIPTGAAWHADPVTGHTWKQDFFANVSYHRVPAHVDFKHIWELGRHQYVVEVARAWLLNRDDRHLEQGRRIISDWIANNPFCHGIHWTSGLEVAMRAISWIWALASAKEGWEQDPHLSQWIGQLSLHGYYLENHLSVYSSPYNHVIGEATALYLLGAVFRRSPDAERWQDKGRQLLHDFGPRQFYKDGFCVEQAIGYHYYTLGFLMLAMLAGRTISDQQLRLDELVHRGFSAGAAFRRPDGTWPAIGDVDSASSIPVAREEYWDFSSLHRLAAVALAEPSLAFEPTRFIDETYWLLGVNGVNRSLGVGGAAPQNRVTLLPHAGYFVARQDNDWILLDSGPISAGLHRDGTPSAAHGHADTLQLLMHWGGREVLRDAGMPNYAGNAKRMDYFRSPAAHNSVSLAAAHLVRPAGRLAWSHHVARADLHGAGDPACWRACGEVTWDDCQIQRHIFAVPGEAVWIADWLMSSGPQTANWSWQLVDSDWAIARQSKRHLKFSCKSLEMQSMAARGDLQCDLVGPDSTGCEGWYSPGYGVLEKGRVLRLRLPVFGPALVLTVLGTPRHGVTFMKDGQELRLPLAPPGAAAVATRSTKQRSYDSLGGGTWWCHA